MSVDVDPSLVNVANVLVAVAGFLVVADFLVVAAILARPKAELPLLSHILHRGPRPMQSDFAALI